MKNTVIVLCTCLAFLFVACDVLRPSGASPVTSEEDISAEFTSPALGCSNFTVYKSNELKSKWIVVDAILDSLALSTAFKTLEIRNFPLNLKVHYDYYSINRDSTVQSGFRYCNDVVFVGAQDLEVWKCIDGFIDIKRSEIDSIDIFYSYTVSLILRNVHFVNPAETDTVFVRELHFDTVGVGVLPG